MWTGRLGHINAAEHAIDLKYGAKPFKSAPYPSGPAVRKLEASGLYKQLEAGATKPTASELVALVLFFSTDKMVNYFFRLITVSSTR